MKSVWFGLITRGRSSWILLAKILGANSLVLSGPLILESRWSCPCWCIPRSVLVLAWPWSAVVAWGLPHSHIFQIILLGFHRAFGPCLWVAGWWLLWFLPGKKVGSCWRSWPLWLGWGHFPNIFLVLKRCLGHAPLTHRGWHKILWCNERGPSGQRLSLHRPLTPSRMFFSFWFGGNQRMFWNKCPHT